MPNRLPLVLLCVLPLGACAGPDVATLAVVVSDKASGAAISGAKVVADTPSHDHPFSVESMLGQTGPMQKTSYTDDAGVAVVEYVPGRSVRIGVLARGYPLLIGNISEPWLGETALLGDRADDGERQLRARVTPTTRPD